MSRQFMAVCVVCLLCADHLPCLLHSRNTIISPSKFINTGKDNIEKYDHHLINNADKLQHTNTKSNVLCHESSPNCKSIVASDSIVRMKRHHHDEHDNHNHDDDHSTVENKNTKKYIKKLFEKFGDGENKDVMSIEGFERMIDKLGLYSLKINDSVLDQLPPSQKSTENNDKCLTSIEIFHRVSSKPKNFETEKHVTPINNNSSIQNGTTIERRNVTSIKKSTFLSPDDLEAICPIILDMMTADTSVEKSGCMRDSSLEKVPHHDDDDDHIPENDMSYVWLYSILTILGVSLCGLFGVAVIPCMDKHFYNQLLQFLVALAVGTLTGDALLHLLPHSFMAVKKNDGDPHQSMIIKGLIAVLGIIFFFFTERALNIFADMRKKRQKKDKPCSRVRVMRDQSSVKSINTNNSDKICMNKYSSYPYCYDEIATDTKDDHHHHHQHHNDKNVCDTQGAVEGEKVIENNQNHIEVAEPQQSLLKYNKDQIDNVSTPIDNNPVVNNGEKLMPEESFTVILREHESKHHGHSHTHGHVHSPPRSLSSVAWMVVMGDGLHNFTDGMTIGAAFSNSIPGGFSTAVAVFCHELPHELGDFAVLLKAGMSAKQAVYYNILSSVLSFIGMVFGILLGEIPEASAWVFACAAGLFIYIALVDMMPEITQSHKDAGFSQCILQLAGMLCGLGIMLAIAYYEHDLMHIFSH